MDWLNENASSMLTTLIGKSALGVVTGMDGTIAPVVEDPDGSPPTPRCRELLHALSQVTPLVAVLSARPSPDLHALVDLPELLYAGNRGLEMWNGGRMDFAPEVEASRPALEAAMSALYSMIDTRVQIEDGGSVLMVHCDTLDDADQIDALRASVKTVAEENGLRYFEASRMLEIRPSMVLDKGRSLERLVQAHNLEAVVYIGNDMGDLEAFKTVQQMRSSGRCYGVGVAVLNDWTPTQAEERADVMVQGTAGVEELLDWLYRARRDWSDHEASVM